jgi:hypothetical protein
MRRYLAVLSLVGAACGLVPAAASAGTLDQHQDTGAGSGLQVQSMQTVAQTFRAGLTGGLDQVDVWLAQPGGANTPTAPVTVEIRNAFAGTPGPAVLRTTTIPIAGVAAHPGAFVQVPLPTPLPVTAGTDYTIVLSSTTASPNIYSWGRTATESYAAGGSFYTVVPPGVAFNSFPGDQAFRTYVAVSPTGKGKKCKKKRKKGKRGAAAAKKKRKKCGKKKRR